MNIFRNKRIIVFGGTGSIGSEMVRQLVAQKPKFVRVFARDETKHQELLEDLNFHPALRSLIGDIRDADRVKFAMRDIDVAFHAAALKAVPYCEYNPMEAVKTNVFGTQNIVQSAIDQNIEKVVTISTDKAAEPINTMGATKLLAERLTAATTYYKGRTRTTFMAVRFGNVLGSRNSILPIIKKQILDKKPVTITDPKMTRFVMSIPDAVKLVFKATQISKGGEIFILKMPAVFITDLIEVYIELICDKYNINSKKVKIKYIGIRAGEKLNEKLLSDAEALSTYENKELYLEPSSINLPNEIVKAQRYAGFTKLENFTNIDSEKIEKISRDEIRKILVKAELT